jgi:hypothetical protein
MARNGKIVMTDSGKRGVRTTGKTAVFNTNGRCDECCGAVDCQYCIETPLELEVVFSDIATFYACNTNPMSSYSVKILPEPSVGPNGAFTLTQTANPCRWEALVPCTGKLLLYGSNKTCAGAPVEYDIAFYRILLVRGATQYTLFSRYLDAGEIVLLDQVYDKTAAYGAADCVDAMSMGVNTNTPAGYGDLTFGDGTATIAIP